jgi:beta-lactamase regulating signal transducer with metallopeptidase domain
MTAWLIDTLTMTGVILLLILLVRRPVGRWFGPGAAYALWALPMIRLVLPPLVLPQSLAFSPAAHVLTTRAEPVVELTTASRVAVHVMVPAAQASLALPWETVALIVWLGGAVMFLALRTVSYRRMRRELLQESRVIGRSGAVRIVESPAVQAPVAFGVIDRVVALPRGFLASADSDASDFAITHELEHHAGNDLIANMAVQPLFALHWFNPVAWLAWRALRSDQEAACDARVMAGRSRHERERYGRLIASFAAGSRFALAAPMAGPLKGDKPIIHRLKALVRNDVPERHRLLGRSLFAASVIAVPLTASVTYAAQEIAEVPQIAPQPSAPLAPSRPHEVREVTIEQDDGDASSQVREPSNRRTVTRAGTTYHIVTSKPLSDGEVDRMIASSLDDDRRAQDQAAQSLAAAGRAQAQADRVAREAERIALEAQARAPRVEQSFSADGKLQMLQVVSHGRDGRATVTSRTVIDSSCPADRQPRARSVATASGAVSETRVCTGLPDSARHVTIALRQARASVAADSNIPASIRSETLSDLDDAIADARTDTD